MATAEIVAMLLTWTPFLALGFAWNILISLVAMAIGTVLGAVSYTHLDVYKRQLDVGCGSGRYAEALLERTAATIVACDISREAIDELTIRCSRHVACGRLRPVLGDLSVVAKSVGRDERFDLAIMLFGVLGHIYSRTLRRETLAAIRELLRPGGRIVVTVPNAARRFSSQQAAAQRLVQAGHLETGDILYERTTNQIVVEMYYHLYTCLLYTSRCV